MIAFHWPPDSRVSDWRTDRGCGNDFLVQQLFLNRVWEKCTRNLGILLTRKCTVYFIFWGPRSVLGPSLIRTATSAPMVEFGDIQRDLNHRSTIPKYPQRDNQAHSDESPVPQNAATSRKYMMINMLRNKMNQKAQGWPNPELAHHGAAKLLLRRKFSRFT